MRLDEWTRGYKHGWNDAVERGAVEKDDTSALREPAERLTSYQLDVLQMAAEQGEPVGVEPDALLQLIEEVRASREGE